MTLPVRGMGTRRPGRPRMAAPARASARRTSATRLVAIAALVLSLLALYGVTTSPAFGLDPAAVEVHGALWTDRAAVLAALGEAAGARPDLFTIRTDRVVARLRELPAVDTTRPDAARVTVALPAAVRVDLVERVPIVVWEAPSGSFLLDVTGLLFAPMPAPGDPGAAAVADLPTVGDVRAAAAGLTVGSRLDPLVLTVVRKLGALTTARLGSAASGLRFGLSDDEGFTVDAEPAGWHAVFGIYTPTVRPPTLIDTQVACLAGLLAGREASLATIVLSPQPGGTACGTYTLRASK